MKNKIWIRIWIFMGIFYLAGIIFDMGMTYYFYKVNPVIFFEKEGNYHLTDDLNRGIPFFMTLILFLNYFSIIFYFYFFLFNLYFLKDNLLKKIILYSFLLVFFINALQGYFYGTCWLMEMFK